MISPIFKPLLREYDLDILNWSDNIVIERIFQYGDVKQIKLLFRKLPKLTIQTKLENIWDRFDSKTQQFIKVLFPITLSHKSKKDDNIWTKNIPTRNIK